MDLLKGKTILVTGVLTTNSIAFHTARVAQEQGASLVLTGFGRMSLVERVARRLPQPVPVVELDVTDREQLASLAARVGEHTDRLDGVLHSVAFAPQAALGGGFMTAEWEDVAPAVQVSAYSLQAVTRAALPLLADGSGIVGLDFDASRAWYEYDWMGVAKAGLESCARYLASYLGERGIRVNLVAAARCAPRRPPRSVPGTSTRWSSGTSGRRSAGTARGSSRWPGRAWRCSRTGSRPPPARSSMWTAGRTRSVTGRARPSGRSELFGTAAA